MFITLVDYNRDLSTCEYVYKSICQYINTERNFIMLSVKVILLYSVAISSVVD